MKAFNETGFHSEWVEITGYLISGKIEGGYSTVKDGFGESVPDTPHRGTMREAMLQSRCSEESLPMNHSFMIRGNSA